MTEQQTFGKMNPLLGGRHAKPETLEEYLSGVIDGESTVDRYMEKVKGLASLERLYIADVVGIEPDPSGKGVRFRVAVILPGDPDGFLSMVLTLYNDCKQHILLSRQCFGEDLRSPNFIQKVEDAIHGTMLYFFTGVPAVSSTGRPYFKVDGFKKKELVIPFGTPYRMARRQEPEKPSDDVPVFSPCWVHKEPDEYSDGSGYTPQEPLSSLLPECPDD